jgi:hypothetical protein
VQLGDVAGNPSRLIFAEQLGRRSRRGDDVLYITQTSVIDSHDARLKIAASSWLPLSTDVR